MRFEEEAKEIIKTVIEYLSKGFKLDETSKNYKLQVKALDLLIRMKIAKIISDIIDDECWDCEFYLRDNKIHEPKIHEPMWDNSELD